MFMMKGRMGVHTVNVPQSIIFLARDWKRSKLNNPIVIDYNLNYLISKKKTTPPFLRFA